VAATELRPRTATEILDAAFQILKQQYGTFVVLAALAYLPYIIIMMVIGASVSGQSADDQSAALVAGAFASVPLALIWFPIAETAVVVGASDALLGRSVEAGPALRAVLSRFVSVLGAALLKALLLFIAMIVCIMPVGILVAVVGPAAFVAVPLAAIPVAIVYLGLFATPAVVVFERIGVAESIGRAWALARGAKGRVFGVLALAYLVVIAVQLAVTMIAVPLGLNEVAANIAASVLVIFVYPLIGICVALLYYDARIRKEGFDLQVLAGELQGATSGAPYADVR
jgi:hypothetical protein